MRSLFSFIWFFTINIMAIGQNNKVARDSIKYKYGATITPTAFPYSAGIQPGFQFRMGRKINLISEAAFSSAKNNIKYDRINVLKVVSELKYFRDKAFAGSYFSFQAGYISRKFISKDSGVYFKDTAMVGYRSATIKSPVSFVAIKCGREINVHKIFVDFFLGIGVRYVQTSYNSQGPYQISHPRGVRDNIFELLGQAWEQDRDYLKLHGTAGMRVGLRF
jgi:hypothetical protein